MSQNPDFLKGKAHYAQQQFQEAIILFSAAIEKEENPYIYYERAMAYFHLGHNELAMLDFDKCVELQPDNPYRFSSRAYVKDKMGDVQGAIADYEKAIALDPEDAVALNNLGLLEEKLGWKEKSQKHFSMADQLASIQNLTSPAIGSSSDQSAALPGETAQNGWMRVLFQTLTSKTGRQEFVDFVKNGFKLKA